MRTRINKTDFVSALSKLTAMGVHVQYTSTLEKPNSTRRHYRLVQFGDHYCVLRLCIVINSKGRKSYWAHSYSGPYCARKEYGGTDAFSEFEACVLGGAEQ